MQTGIQNLPTDLFDVCGRLEGNRRTPEVCCRGELQAADLSETALKCQLTAEHCLMLSGQNTIDAAALQLLECLKNYTSRW